MKYKCCLMYDICSHVPLITALNLLQHALNSSVTKLQLDKWRVYTNAPTYRVVIKLETSVIAWRALEQPWNLWKNHLTTQSETSVYLNLFLNFCLQFFCIKWWPPNSIFITYTGPSIIKHAPFSYWWLVHCTIAINTLYLPINFNRLNVLSV